MLNTASTTANLIWAALESLILIGGGIKFFFTIKIRLDRMENYTYKRNGGSSMADSLARLEDGLEKNTHMTQKVSREVAKMQGRLDNHIEEHQK